MIGKINDRRKSIISDSKPPLSQVVSSIDASGALASFRTSNTDFTRLTRQSGCLQQNDRQNQRRRSIIFACHSFPIIVMPRTRAATGDTTGGTTGRQNDWFKSISYHFSSYLVVITHRFRYRSTTLSLKTPYQHQNRIRDR